MQVNQQSDQEPYHVNVIILMIPNLKQGQQFVIWHIMLPYGMFETSISIVMEERREFVAIYVMNSEFSPSKSIVAEPVIHYHGEAQNP